MMTEDRFFHLHDRVEIGTHQVPGTAFDPYGMHGVICHVYDKEHAGLPTEDLFEVKLTDGRELLLFDHELHLIEHPDFEWPEKRPAPHQPVRLLTPTHVGVAAITIVCIALLLLASATRGPATDACDGDFESRAHVCIEGGARP